MLSPNTPSPLACTLQRALLLPLLLLTTFTLAPRAAAMSEDELDQHLSQRTWSEDSAGISLRPPLDSTMHQQASDDALVRFVGREGYQLRVYIRRAEETNPDIARDRRDPPPARPELNIARVQELALEQMGTVNNGAITTEQRRVKLGDKPGAIIVYRIPGDRGDWGIAEGFMMVDPRTIVKLQLDVPYKDMAATKPIFEAVLHSLRAQDPEALLTRRKNQLDAGILATNLIDHRRRVAAITEQELFRITADKRDVGYMRIDTRVDKQMNQQGVRVDVIARIDIEDKTVDTVSQFFISSNGRTELWSIRTTIRKETARNTPSVPDVSWAETGARQDQELTITREGPEGIKSHSWDLPEKGYLSQVDLYLLHRLLPTEKREEYGFYAYSPNKGEVAFRYDRMIPSHDGSYQIVSRPTLDQQEQSSHYDSKGNLLRRVLPSGQTIQPTTAKQLEAIWKLKQD